MEFKLKEITEKKIGFKIKSLNDSKRLSEIIANENDLDINVLKGKQLTNVRASGTDDAVTLVTPRKLSLEDMMAYINPDELLEVTPDSLRVRKKYLDPNERKRMARAESA